MPEGEDCNSLTQRCKERVTELVVRLRCDTERTLQLALQKVVRIEGRRHAQKIECAENIIGGVDALEGVIAALVLLQEVCRQLRLRHGPIKRGKHVNCIEGVGCVRLVEAIVAVPAVIASRALDVFDQLMHVKSQ